MLVLRYVNRDRNHHAHTHLVNFEQTNMYNGISSSILAVLSRSLKSCNAIPMNLEPGTCAPMLYVNSDFRSNFSSKFVSIVVGDKWRKVA